MITCSRTSQDWLFLHSAQPPLDDLPNIEISVTAELVFSVASESISMCFWLKKWSVPALGDVKGCSQAEALILSAVAWLCTGTEDYSSHLLVFLHQVLFKIENLVPFLYLSNVLFCLFFFDKSVVSICRWSRSQKGFKGCRLHHIKHYLLICTLCQIIYTNNYQTDCHPSFYNRHHRNPLAEASTMYGREDKEVR